MTVSIPAVVLIGVIGLVGIGLYALLIIRNLIRLVVALQIMVKGAVLALVIAGRLNGKIDVGQSLALTVIVADTIVAVIALALAVQVQRRFGTIDTQALTTLRR